MISMGLEREIGFEEFKVDILLNNTTLRKACVGIFVAVFTTSPNHSKSLWRFSPQKSPHMLFSVYQARDVSLEEDIPPRRGSNL